MQNNKINLYNVLFKIKNQRDKYNSLVHDNKKSLKTYIDLISKDNTELGKEIYFIMNNSKLLYEHAPEKENKIIENDIYQEFCTIKYLIENEINKKKKFINNFNNLLFFKFKDFLTKYF